MARVLKFKLSGSIDYEYVEEEEEIWDFALNRQGRLPPATVETVIRPEEINRFKRETLVRAATVEQFLAEHKQFVWEFGKEFPALARAGFGPQPIITPAQIEERFPLPGPLEPTFRVIQPVPPPRAALPRVIYRGTITLPSGETRAIFDEEDIEQTFIAEY